MTVRHDPEIEHFKRSINLVAYAMTTGYDRAPARATAFSSSNTRVGTGSS